MIRHDILRQMVNIRKWLRRAGIVMLAPFIAPKNARDAIGVEFDKFLLRLASRRFLRRSSLSNDKELYLNLGAGTTRTPGFLHLDYFGSKADLQLDLRDPLPFRDASVDGIFSEHTLEHMTYNDCAKLLAECLRVMKPGAYIRLVLPDLGVLAKSYASDRADLAEYGKHVMAPHKYVMKTPMMGLAFMAQQFGHISAWDEETLCDFLRTAGFIEVEKLGFGHGHDPKLLIDNDDPGRTLFSVYVEGKRI